MNNYRCYLMTRVQIFKSFRQDSAGEESFTFWVHHPGSAMETQMAAYLVTVSLMMMLPSFVKPVLVLSFDFWLSRFRTFTCRNWGINDPPTLCLKCVLLIQTRQRSSAWALLVGKHQQNQNFIYSSLALGTLNKMKLMLCALFNYNMGDKIRRLSMHVAFKFIWPKGLSCLTHGSIVYLYIMYQTLHDYDYHLPEIRCATFQLIWLRPRSRKWCQEQA